MVATSTLALLASLIMAGAGAAAVAAIVVTVRAQLPALRKVLADARTIAQDREFLVQVVGIGQIAAPVDMIRLRRLPVRAVKPARTAPAKAFTVPAQPLRAAA